MAKIFTADTDYFVVADTMDSAVDKYYQERNQYPETIAVFKEDGNVFTESTVIGITPSITPEAAETDGATVTPSTPVYIREGDNITFQATPSVGYPTFVEWQDGSGAQLSTANPFTYTAGAFDLSIVAVFSA